MKMIEVDTKVENGRLKSNKATIKAIIKSFEGKFITISFKPQKRTRSGNQNKYYWGVIIPIWRELLFTEWGEHYSTKETHEFLKYNCNFIEKVNTTTGEIMRLSKSTTENSVTEQELFLDHARKLALEMFNTEIPLPNQQLTIYED